MRDDCITVALGLPEVRVVREEERVEEIVVEVAYRRESAACPRCGRKTPKVHSTRVQKKRDRRLWDKPVFLLLRKRRFRCLACRKVFSEPDPVFGHRKRSTRRLREHLGQEALDQTVRRVAQKEGVGEGLVRRCVTELAERLLGSLDPDDAGTARVLGLDEFSIKKRQVYDTAIMDLERRQVLGVVTGRGRKEVQRFLERLPAPDRVQAVVMDMHEPFRQAVELCLPQAKIVVDKFHVLRHVHWALDQVRIRFQEERRNRDLVFRSRFLLLRAMERLTSEQWNKLMLLFARYPELRRAWALKEAFRLWYRSPTRAGARAHLALWEEEVRQRGPAPFRSLFPMLDRWRNEILNYFDHRYTNGFVEGKNNRIKVIKRLGYGYRNNANFRQRILLTNFQGGHSKAA